MPCTRDARAAAILVLFIPVMFVRLMMGNTTVHHIYGVQPYYLMVCDAPGIDRAWYEVLSHQGNSA